MREQSLNSVILPITLPARLLISPNTAPLTVHDGDRFRCATLNSANRAPPVQTPAHPTSCSSALVTTHQCASPAIPGAFQLRPSPALRARELWACMPSR